MRFCRNTACALILLVQGCHPAPDTELPARYGLGRSAIGQQVTEQAIFLVDAMLPADNPTRLTATWPPCQFFPTLTFARSGDGRFSMHFVTDKGFDNGLRFDNSDVVPVYLVDGTTLGEVENSFVPDGERCIFVNSRNLDKLFQMFYMSGDQALQQHNTFDKSLVLALIFLHELGHLHFGDRGSYGPPARLDLTELQNPSASIRNPEVRADRFASELLNNAWTSQEMQGPLGAPYGRAFIASNIYRAIATGFNSYDLTRDPQGILHGIPNPALFRQAGYSHLNLYLRLLVMLQQLDPNDNQMKELKWVDEALAIPTGCCAK